MSQPPPSPPSPPSAPPPNHPPYPPLPPVPPPDGLTGYRIWSPGILEVPQYDDAYDGFTVTCQVARCGQAHVVYTAASQLSAHAFVRDLIEKRVYSGSLCPYECQRVVSSHGLSLEEEEAVRNGVGSQTASVQYPGYLEDPVNGLATYARKATAAGFAQTATPIYKKSGLTMAQCGKEMYDHKILAMHGLWVYNHTTSLAARVGECAFYLVARSTLQLGVWRGFTEYAKEVLDLAHIRGRIPTELISVAAAPPRSVACDETTSTVCMYWSEFDLDPTSELGCFPASDGGNVATPTVLLTELGSAGIRYPPPTPPPPTPPTPPPIPASPLSPGGSYVCNARSLPSARYVRDTSGLRISPPAPPGGVNPALVAAFSPVEVESRKVVCWRWDEGGLWPPVNAHQDAYESQPVCGDINSREIRWEDDFRQSKLYDIYRSKLNTDTCRSASNGICEDGGKGDTHNYQHFLWVSNGMSIARDSEKSTWSFNRMEYTHIIPAPGQYVYVHAWQTEANSGCYLTGSECTVGYDTNGNNRAQSRPGRLTVTSSGTNTLFGVNADNQERPFFTAESLTNAQIQAIDVNGITTYCRETSTANCVTEALGCPSEAIADTETFPCSWNMWALGASEGTPYCDLGTDRSDCGDR